jgi:energy-coupling factor transporter ATP-binding protein EcfA2
MEYLVLLAALAAFVVVIFAREAWQAKKRRQHFIQSLYDGFGALPTREYTLENSAHIPGYYQRHKEAGQIDDITWNDLNMDEIFRRINYTHSATGEEYLYYLLRSVGQSREKLAHFEEIVNWFAAHADERVNVQFLASELGYTGKYSLYDYIDNLDALGERSNFRHHLTNSLFLLLIVLAPFKLSLALLGIALLGVWQIVSYFKDKGEMEPYITSFAYVVRLLVTCEKIAKIEMPVCERELAVMQECIRKMQGVRRGAFWVFTASNSRTSGNPLELILDYLRMIFHVDLIVFNKMLRQLRSHLEDADILIAQAGYLEAAICVGAFRASLENGWCVPELLDEKDVKIGKNCEIVVEGGYHPLLEHPVKNSIRADRGVLLTGSNASGKSTFLKMLAVNAILAQTICTCTADSYRAPLFAVYSSMALRDDIGSGESYYIVEIKALKRILDAAKEGRNVLCFVDEVLRGTNTVERIAASTQILKSLTGRRVLCFAATHDIELAGLLQDSFDNYHFEEEIKDGDISFPYKLLQGKATTRNAIRLLEMMGYEPEIISRAMKSAEGFLKTGTWQA